MKNKGFTLVELLAVIAVLLILITLITPKVINQLNSSEDVTQKEQINTLINIAKIYTNQNTEKLPENNSISVITIQELKESGLINKSQILDPKTKEELTGCILIKDENNKYNYEYNEDKCNNLITVTFDPQGGQLDQTSKNVIPNETYGELPTPTREGYTFMGWRGKNMLNLHGRTLQTLDGGYPNTAKRNFTGKGIYYAVSANNYYIVNANTVYDIDPENNNISHSSSGSNGYGIGIDILILPNTSYTISCSPESQTVNRYGIFKKDGTFIKFSYGKPSVTFDSGEEAYWLLYVNAKDASAQQAGDILTDYNIQIEEGNTATSFEPYQEYTSSTTVTKQENHTLYAIWQANS